MQYSGRLLAAAFCLIAGTQAANANLIQNGSFTTGNLSGWTLATTANGSLGFSPVPDVVSFDVTGTGAQNAARFEVGQATFAPGTSEGGSLSQMIVTTAGPLKIHLDYAVFEPTTFTNGSAGDLTVLLDGMPEAGINFGSIGPGWILRAPLSFAIPVTAGHHTLELLMTRTFLAGPDITPYQYLTNISATQAPEPLTLAVFGSGLACFAAMRRRKNSP